MDDWKNFFASRTVWANLVGLAALVLGSLGHDLAGVDQGAVLDAVMQIVAGLSFLASIAFRVAAKRRLSL